MSADNLSKWLFETAKAQAKMYRETPICKHCGEPLRFRAGSWVHYSGRKPESMEQFPSVETQQAHWQAKMDEAGRELEAERLRQQREREQLEDWNRERDNDLEYESRRDWETDHTESMEQKQ